MSIDCIANPIGLSILLLVAGAPVIKVHSTASFPVVACQEQLTEQSNSVQNLDLVLSQIWEQHRLVDWEKNNNGDDVAIEHNAFVVTSKAIVYWYCVLSPVW